MQPALGDSSGCVRLRNASDSRAIGAQRGRLARRRRGSRPTGRSRACAAAGCSRSRTPSRRPARPRSCPSGVTQRDRVDELADEPALEMRVAVDRAADRARRAGPGLEPATPWLIVQRTSPLIVTPASARMRSAASAPHLAAMHRMTRPRTPASATSTFEPPPSTVTGTPALAGDRSARRTSSLACGSHEPVGGPADLEGRQRRRAARRADAVGAERFAQACVDTASCHRAPRAAVRAAASASMRRRAACTARTRSSRLARAARRAEVRGDHRRDLRIAAGRLTIGHQQDRLAGRRHLQRADRRRVRQDVGRAACCERRALQAISHAVRLRRDR